MSVQLSRQHQPDFERDLLTQLAQRWPMNRITTDLHRRDESGHAVIFRELACSLYLSLGPAERELFTDALAAGLTAFYALDFDPWVPVAQAGGFDIEAGQIADLMSSRPTPARDTGTLQQLLRQLGIREELFRPPAAQGRN
jgi:alpha-N-dichloroacetyl-p-aminophenylserinol N-oxygenase